MPALHPTPAALASSDVDPKRAHDHARHRQFFLVLRRHARLDHGITTARTARREPRVMRFVAATGRTSTRFRAIRAAGFATGSLRMRLQRFGKRRGLSKPGSSRGIQLLFQPGILVAQPIPLAFQSLDVLLHPLQFRAQSLVLAADAVDVFCLIIPRRHVAFMPESPPRYKRR